MDTDWLSCTKRFARCEVRIGAHGGARCWEHRTCDHPQINNSHSCASGRAGCSRGILGCRHRPARAFDHLVGHAPDPGGFWMVCTTAAHVQARSRDSSRGSRRLWTWPRTHPPRSASRGIPDVFREVFQPAAIRRRFRPLQSRRDLGGVWLMFRAIVAQGRF